MTKPRKNKLVTRRGVKVPNGDKIHWFLIQDRKNTCVVRVNNTGTHLRSVFLEKTLLVFEKYR